MTTEEGASSRQNMDGTFDFKEVEHLTAVTPLARRDLISARQQQREDTAAAAPPSKKIKLDADGTKKSESSTTTTGSAKSRETAKKSVRYPKLNYTKVLPSVADFIKKHDGCEELALVDFLQAVMETDIKEVSKILVDTKFDYLGEEMSKFSQTVLKPIIKEMQGVVARDRKVREEVEAAKRDKAQETKEVAELEAAIQRLKEVETKWLELEKSSSSTGGDTNSTEGAEGGDGDPVAAAADEAGLLSEVLIKAEEVLQTSPQQIKEAVKGTVAQVGRLEDLLEGMQDTVETAEEKQRVLFEQYQKVSMAPYVDVHRPKTIVQKMVQ